MSDLGWVAETSEQRERVINLRKYFEVYQLSIVKERRISIGVDSKREFSSNEEFYSVVAWTQKARLEVRNTDNFWTSFFKQIGYIVIGHIDSKDGNLEKEEKETTEIASQTNILALNASIEAVRAGENMEEVLQLVQSVALTQTGLTSINEVEEEFTRIMSSNIEMANQLANIDDLTLP